jgi:hypothetical protein
MASKVFISYSHQDQALRQELDKHLSNLKRQQVISSWYDGDIIPGTEWRPQIIERLNSAEIILLLISADFMASDFCYSVELAQAIARHEAHQAHVIPILLRPTDWEGAPFAKLQMLPTGARAVTKWPSHDEAFEDVVQGIKKALSVAPTNRHLNVADSAAIPSIPRSTSPSTPAAKPSTLKPIARKIPEMGQTFLSDQDRNWIINIVDTVVDVMSITGIKNLLRGKLPDPQINRINFRDGSRNIAENIIGNLEPRGASNPLHYHALGAFLKDLIENDLVDYDAAKQIVVLLFSYTLVTDRTEIEKLSTQFQVPMQGQ